MHPYFTSNMLLLSKLGHHALLLMKAVAPVPTITAASRGGTAPAWTASNPNCMGVSPTEVGKPDWSSPTKPTDGVTVLPGTEEGVCNPPARGRCGPPF